MRTMLVSIVVLFSALSAHPAVAQSSAAMPSLMRQRGTPFIGTARNPYRGIFDVPGRQPQLQGTATTEQTRSVVCGMTVIQGDPELDARILAQPKPGQSVAPKVRIIEPKTCC